MEAELDQLTLDNTRTTNSSNPETSEWGYPVFLEDEFAAGPSTCWGINE